MSSVLWAKTQQLQEDAFRQLQNIYGNIMIIINHNVLLWPSSLSLPNLKQTHWLPRRKRLADGSSNAYDDWNRWHWCCISQLDHSDHVYGGRGCFGVAPSRTPPPAATRWAELDQQWPTASYCQLIQPCTTAPPRQSINVGKIIIDKLENIWISIIFLPGLKQHNNAQQHIKY